MTITTDSSRDSPSLKSRSDPDTGQTLYACPHRIHGIKLVNGIQTDVWSTQEVWEPLEKALKCIHFRDESKIALTEAVQTSHIKPLLDEKSDPADIAAQLLRTYHVATFTDTGQIYYWKDGVYHPNGEAFLSEQVQSAARESGLERIVTKHFVTETIAHIQRSTYHDRTEFDNNPRLLNMKNGFLDLETSEFHDHDSKILSTIQLPVKYDKNAKCEKFLKFLAEVLYPEDIPVIQELFGYCLWKDYLIHKAFMGIGDGSNGKSTLLNVLEALLGPGNVSNCSLQDIQNRRFATSELYGKMVNVYADLPDSALKSTGTFKMLTGRDTINAEYKFRNSFRYVNYAKLIFSCNRIPRVLDDDSSAFFRRWILVTFPNTFQGEKENKNLLVELTTSEELSGILNWSIDGLIRLHTQNWTFSYSKSTEEIREEYVRKSDPIAAFVMDCLSENVNGRITKTDLYSKFCEYCNKKRLPAVTKDAFFKNLPRHIQYTEAKTNTGGERVRICVGIEFLNPDKEADGGQQKL